MILTGNDHDQMTTDRINSISISFYHPHNILTQTSKFAYFQGFFNINLRIFVYFMEINLRIFNIIRIFALRKYQIVSNFYIKIKKRIYE